MARDFRRAFVAVWLILSSATATAVAAPLVVPADALFGIFPECAARSRGTACSMCGMTTAFVRIASGDLEGAQQSNRGSVALWGGSVLNATGALMYIFLKIRRQ